MSSKLKTVAGVAVVSSLLTVIACGSSGEAPGEFGEDNLNASSSSGTSGTSGGSSGDFGTSGGTSGSSGSSGGTECAAQEAAATLTKSPVDIIFVIDNSGSMSGEIAEVEKQINDNFATIIEASKIDYRVIMVTRHGANTSQRVCVKAPLSGAATCTPAPAQPVETAKFFHHSVNVQSTDAWCRLDEFYAKTDEFGKHPTGWGSLLRAAALKVFVVISDDRVSCSFGGTTYNDRVSAGTTVADGTAAAAAFDSRILALSPAQFGTAAKRNYVWHSIIALKEFDSGDKTKAHPSTAPIVTDICTPGAQQPATGHQAMSKLTGGLRYPTCGLDYTTIFTEMAKGVISGAKVACEFPVPPAPAGQTLDLATVVPHYTPGAGGAGKDFAQVANAAACAADKFYIENNAIKLCPATCDAVQADPKAAIKVIFGCAIKGAN
jgi:hypothetical protein